MGIALQKDTDHGSHFLKDPARKWITQPTWALKGLIYIFSKYKIKLQKPL